MTFRVGVALSLCYDIILIGLLKISIVCSIVFLGHLGNRPPHKNFHGLNIHSEASVDRGPWIVP